MAKAVHDMFKSIAPRYDLANDVLSFGIHHLWRNRALDLAGVKPGMTLLDLCTGTGDLAQVAAKRVGANGKVIGLDFVAEMLNLAEKKNLTLQSSATSGTRTRVDFVRGDATCLPFTSGFADCVTIAFGIRNVDDPVKSLEEMKRILKPGGRAVVLEFGQPTWPIFSKVYQIYSQSLMPIIGGLVTGNRAAYEYLPRTSAAFPAGERFLALMQQAGFSSSTAHSLFGGVAYVYLGRVS